MYLDRFKCRIIKWLLCLGAVSLGIPLLFQSSVLDRADNVAYQSEYSHEQYTHNGNIPPVESKSDSTSVKKTVAKKNNAVTTKSFIGPLNSPTPEPPTWPVYKFDGEFVNVNTSKPDHQLLDKMLTDMLRLHTPIFRLKGTNTSLQIPPIIHQSWRDINIPSVALQWTRQWPRLHSNWTYIFWTDKKAEEFVKQYYPLLWPYFDSWNIPVQKSDMFRIIAVYAFGGFWADLDMEPLKHLEPVRNWSSCILARHPDIQTYLIDLYDRGDIYATNYTYPINAFFACRPGHPFLFYMLSRLVQNTPKFTKSKCPMHRTVACSGPRLMALANAFYLRSVKEEIRLNKPEYNVICPDADWFMPTYDTTYRQHVPRIRRRCKRTTRLGDFEKSLCTRFRTTRNVAIKSSYTVHHWFHSYNFKKRTRKYSLDDKVKGVKYRMFDDKDLFEVVDIKSYL